MLTNSLSKITLLILSFVVGFIIGVSSTFLFMIWRSRKELEKYSNQFPIDNMADFPKFMDISDDQINHLMKNFLKKEEIQKFADNMRKSHDKSKKGNK